MPSHEATYLYALRGIAETAVAAVMMDLEHATGLRPEVTVDLWPEGVIRIAIDGNFCTPSVSERTKPAVVAEVAGYFQEQIDFVCWPACPEHTMGLHAEVRDGSATWRCHFGDHSVALVGSLRSERPSEDIAERLGE